MNERGVHYPLLLRAFIVASAVILASSSFLAAQDRDSTACKPSQLRVARLQKSGEGWNLDFVDKANVKSRVPYGETGGQRNGLYAVSFGTRKKTVSLPEVVVNPCDKSAVLSALFFIPEQVVGIEKNGRVFAYLVSAQLVSGPGTKAASVGAQMNVVYYDMHGTGYFDVVQAMAPIGLPFIPDWIKE